MESAVVRCRPSGPSPADILLVGEAPGEHEDNIGLPFVGPAGRELDRMLKQSGIDPKSVRKTNVFMDRPPGNKIEAFCVKRADVPKDYTLPPLSQGNYVRVDKLPELNRLRDEIEETAPKLTIALGNTACWALLRQTGIKKLRGSLFPCELSPASGRVLPTYHPAAILRDWSLRVISVADFIKGQRYVTSGFTPPSRELWLEPTLDEVREFFDRFIYADPPSLLSFDIEAIGEIVTCIGFAPTPKRAITVPFYHTGRPDRNYWASKEDEMGAYGLCKGVLESEIPKIGQNGLYDIQVLHGFGIRVRAYRHDLMLRHHALQPELPKGLGFLGSIYTDEAPWKLMRPRRKEQFKLEDE